jgi:hypothetical protein
MMIAAPSYKTLSERNVWGLRKRRIKSMLCFHPANAMDEALTLDPERRGGQDPLHCFQKEDKCIDTNQN